MSFDARDYFGTERCDQVVKPDFCVVFTSCHTVLAVLACVKLYDYLIYLRYTKYVTYADSLDT